MSKGSYRASETCSSALEPPDCVSDIWLISVIASLSGLALRSHVARTVIRKVPAGLHPRFSGFPHPLLLYGETSFC